MQGRIYLTSLPKGSDNPFETYPALRGIWEPELAKRAEASIAYEVKEAMLDAERNSIFLVILDSEVIGVTGFFIGNKEEIPSNEPGSFRSIGLRWTGIIPKHRGFGFGVQVIHALSAIIKDRFPTAEYLVELAPQHEKEIIHYFQTIGFTFLYPEEVFEEPGGEITWVNLYLPLK